MSQQDLFDYVMNTPHNTNPAILKQLIDANSSGGITSWNDLTDKPFGETKAQFELVPETKLEYSGVYGCFVLTGSLAIVEGQEYTVVWNGTPYVCVAKVNEIGTLNLGNMNSIGGEDTEEPFLIQIGVLRGETAVNALDNSSEVSIKILGYEVKKIDVKYLPKAAAVANAAGETVTSAEFNALLTALRNAGYLSE